MEKWILFLSMHSRCLNYSSLFHSVQCYWVFWKLPEFGWHLIKLLYFIRPTRLPDFWQCWAQATFLNSHQRNMCHFFNFCVTTPLCCYFNTTQSHDSLLLSSQIYVFGVLKFHLIYIFIHKIWFTKWRILAPFYFHATVGWSVEFFFDRTE